MIIKVLIVEDDPMVAKFNRHYLDQLEGFECVGWAASAAEARELAEREEPDLLLLDLYMQQSGGLDLLSSLRKSGSPVDAIIISAASDHTSIRKALQLGAVDYLIKPFEFERFRASLTDYRHDILMMARTERLSQDELDQLVRYRGAKTGSEPGSSRLPKGLTDPTLRLVWSAVPEDGALVSTEEVAARGSISRISARKYLAFLTEIGALQMEMEYGGPGRPVYKYKQAPGGAQLVKGYMD